MLELRPFQKRFMRALDGGKFNLLALTGPRALGKSSLAAHILERCLTPGDSLFKAGAEYLLGAASLPQARLCFRFVREALEPTGEYRFMDSAQRIGITHKPTNTTLRVFSSDAKGSFGIVGTPVLVLDEPGALENVGGELLSDSILTAMGKPGSRLRVVMIGTLAPMATRAGHWWYDIIAAGTTGRRFVMNFQGNADKWDQWPNIRKANPLSQISPELREQLLEERDAARKDSRLKARFLSYRLNLPSADEAEMLLTVDDFRMATERPVGIPAGRPIVGIDLGQGRSWSAAVAVWQSGRVDALAVAPGLPDLATQERRDNVPSGTYRKLFDRGVLAVADGLHVQPPGQLWETICDRWGIPVSVVCDRFRLGELQDAVQGSTRLEPRVTQWSTASADIRALRRIARDGPLSIVETARLLIASSLMAALVKNDDAGNVRLVKKSRDNRARDDVAAALTLAAGAWDRASGQRVKAASYAVV